MGILIGCAQDDNSFGENPADTEYEGEKRRGEAAGGAGCLMFLSYVPELGRDEWPASESGLYCLRPH